MAAKCRQDWAPLRPLTSVHDKGKGEKEITARSSRKTTCSLVALPRAIELLAIPKKGSRVPHRLEGISEARAAKQIPIGLFDGPYGAVWWKQGKVKRVRCPKAARQTRSTIEETRLALFGGSSRHRQTSRPEARNLPPAKKAADPSRTEPPNEASNQKTTKPAQTRQTPRQQRQAPPRPVRSDHQ